MVTTPPRPTATASASTTLRRRLPLSVWLTTAVHESPAICRNGCCPPVTARLAHELINACTQAGDLIIDLHGAGHVLASSALRLGRHVVAVTGDPALLQTIRRSLSRTQERGATRIDANESVLAHFRGRAALVVIAHTAEPARRLDHEPAETSLPKTAALLRDGGHLAIVTGLHHEDNRVYDPVPQLIRQARQAGLAYLQHIVALYAVVRHGQITPPRLATATATRRAAAGGAPVSVRVHSDVLLFTRSAIAASGKDQG
jgi:hypothetical protein